MKKGTGRMALLVMLLALGLVVGSCSSASSDTTVGSGTVTPSTSGGTGPAVTVAMKDVAFVPADVSIKAGQAVAWVNQDAVQHDVVANDGAFKSPLLDQGQTFTFTFPTAGSFSYYCAIHPQMKGTVTVQP